MANGDGIKLIRYFKSTGWKEIARLRRGWHMQLNWYQQMRQDELKFEGWLMFWIFVAAAVVVLCGFIFGR